LEAIGGTWTRENLIEFIRDPQGFAPGTTMVTTTQLTQMQIEDLVNYLSRLR
jgi:cytochrome c2